MVLRVQRREKQLLLLLSVNNLLKLASVYGTVLPSVAYLVASMRIMSASLPTSSDP